MALTRQRTIIVAGGTGNVLSPMDNRLAACWDNASTRIGPFNLWRKQAQVEYSLLIAPSKISRRTLKTIKICRLVAKK
jgi:hypothetical protein